MRYRVDSFDFRTKSNHHLARRLIIRYMPEHHLRVRLRPVTSPTLTIESNSMRSADKANHPVPAYAHVRQRRRPHDPSGVSGDKAPSGNGEGRGGGTRSCSGQAAAAAAHRGRRRQLNGHPIVLFRALAAARCCALPGPPRAFVKPFSRLYAHRIYEQYISRLSFPETIFSLRPDFRQI